MKTISYSSMRTFSECPLKYKLTYIDHIKIKGKSNIYGAFGSAVHLCIQRFYNNGNFERKSLIALWAQCFYESIHKHFVEPVSVKEEQRLLKQGYPILQKFYSRQLQQGLLKKPIAVELEFNINCKNHYGENVLLVGKIDIIFDTEDGFEIIDYKTTASRQQWVDQRVTFQLVLYYIAFTLLKKSYKTAKCKICLEFLRPGIKNYFTITKRDQIKALQTINKHLYDVSISSFTPNPTKESCKYCQYTHLCSANQINDKAIIKKPLFPYQKADVAFMLDKKRVLNANEMGLGKTIEMIYIGEHLHKEGTVNKILVVTPNNMKYQWDSKINEFAKKPTIEIISGNKSERARLYDNDALWTIASYDNIRTDVQYINEKWDMIILDDPSVFKYYRTKTREAVNKLKLNKSTNYKFILTATPIENNLTEMYSIIRYLDFRIFGRFSSFERTYLKRGYFNDIKGYKNIFKFIEKIQPILVRNKVDNVQKDLPPVVMKYEYIDFLPEQAKMYDAVVESLAEYLLERIEDGKAEKVIDSTSLSKFTYLREICDSTALVANTQYSAKCIRLDEVLQKILPNKVIIFSEFARMLDILHKDLKHKTIMVTGRDNAEGKHAKVELFKKSKDINILLCTDVLKYGQDLQCAHYMINFDLPWKYTTLEQRWGRERRIGQTSNKVVVINFVMNGGCEDRMIEILGYKKKLSSIIDGKRYNKIDIPSSSGITYKTLNEIIQERGKHV